MADIDFNLIGKMEEVIKTLTFRNKASFKIGKGLRKKAYTMAIDIVVKSVDYNLYENSKANPSIQFYGYCVLVFQDMTSIEIPIHFPRQRLYYAIQREAFRQWRGYVNYYENYLLHAQTHLTLGLILAAFEIPPVELDSQLAKTQWIELPLREVYVKCQKNTQFEIEYTAWNPVEFIDPLTGQPNNGESNQDDGDKDDGLPKDGIQPKRNEPTSPFAGNPSPSSFEEIGLKGFEEIDDSLLNNAGVYNLPTDSPATQTTEGWYWRIVWNTSASSNACEPMTATYIKSAPRTANFRIDSASPNNAVCNGYFNTYWSIFDPISGATIKTRYAYASNGEVSGVRLYGLLPVADDNFLG